MLAKDTLSSAEFRRTKAEAAEIATRAAHLRPRPAARVSRGAASPRRIPLTGALFGLCHLIALMLWLGAAIVGAVWLFDQISWQGLADFIAPTAAQARDTGWVALSEAAH